eukprot:symbB.v1.2.025323.t1/scaffold2451.1/size78874/8
MGQCHPKCCGPTEGGPVQGTEDEDRDDIVATDEASIIQPGPWHWKGEEASLRSSQGQVGTTLVQQISLLEERKTPHKLTGDWDLQPVLSEKTRESSDDPGFFEVSP